MRILDLSRDDCLDLLARSRLGRLACSKENQPYIVPVYYAFHQPVGGEPCLYGFTTAGRKVEWMRANPLVSVEIDEVKAFDDWFSVVVCGRFEELGDHSSHEAGIPRLHSPPHLQPSLARETAHPGDERHLAYTLLQSQAVWWEPGASRDLQSADREPFAPIYYRVSIDTISGHRANPEHIGESPAASSIRDAGWLQLFLDFLRGSHPPS